MTDLVRKSLQLLLKRQTNILSAAFIIMATVIVSQLLGLVRERLLLSIFGASNTLGIFHYATQLPETLFQLVIAAALSSAFIPVFSDLLAKDREREAHKMASTLLVIGLFLFLILSIILSIFAPFFLSIFNLGGEFSPDQMTLMVNLMRIIIFGQVLFIIGTFFTALLQSYNHFFIPGIAGALYNLGIIIGIAALSGVIGIYAAPVGIVFGALIYILVQIPLARKTGFSFVPDTNYIKSAEIKKILQLMWPRTISIVVLQLGTIAVASFISFLDNPGRMNLIYNLGRTLAFAPVVLFGQTIAQAAFPVLSREKDRLDDFRLTFITSFNHMLYLILPISAIILVLRIPIVRLIYGADMFDWDATVLTGRVLACFSISIFAQALSILLYRAFFALHNTVIPLAVGALSTLTLILLSYTFIVLYHFDLQSIALAFSLASIAQTVVLFILLDRKTGGFAKGPLFIAIVKFFFATLFMGFALYIPIKLLDQLVFDTTRTVNLIILTGISTFAGLVLYLFLTWLFNVHEAMTYVQILRKMGNWREILGKSDEIIEAT
jgi:putative peptidoglycan lipid II flippase